MFNKKQKIFKLLFFLWVLFFINFCSNANKITIIKNYTLSRYIEREHYNNHNISINGVVYGMIDSSIYINSFLLSFFDSKSEGLLEYSVQEIKNDTALLKVLDIQLKSNICIKNDTIFYKNKYYVLRKLNNKYKYFTIRNVVYVISFIE